MTYCRVTEQLFEVIRLLEEENKKSRDYGTGVLITHGEALFLETVLRYPGENVSALSERLGITKGAVTQMVEKLSQKELIGTVQRDGNKKEKYFRPTQKGVLTIQGRQTLHRQGRTEELAWASLIGVDPVVPKLAEVRFFPKEAHGLSRDRYAQRFIPWKG